MIPASTTTINYMQAPDELMQGTLDRRAGNSNTCSVSPIPRGYCDIGGCIETNLERLPQDSPSSCLVMDIELVQAVYKYINLKM